MHTDMSVVIKKWRTHHRMSISELARRSGISKGYIHAIDRGHNKPSLEIVERIAAVFGMCVVFTHMDVNAVEDDKAPLWEREQEAVDSDRRAQMFAGDTWR